MHYIIAFPVTDVYVAQYIIISTHSTYMYVYVHICMYIQMSWFAWLIAFLLGHSMSNQHKKMMSLSDFSETLYIHVHTAYCKTRNGLRNGIIPRKGVWLPVRGVIMGVAYCARRKMGVAFNFGVHTNLYYFVVIDR